MKLSGVIISAALAQGFLFYARAADPAKVDYTGRNAPFAAAVGVTPDKRAPELNSSLQNRRVEPAVVDKKSAAVGERRAGIDLTETREKTIVGKDSRQPEVRERILSSYDHRESRIKTSTPAEKPPIVTRYQDSLSSASATNMARFPALDRATSVRINRFVFRKNESPGTGAASTAPVVSAARGSAP